MIPQIHKIEVIVHSCATEAQHGRLYCCCIWMRFDILGVVILVRDAAAQLLGPADRSDGLRWRTVEVGTGALRYP